MKKFVLIALSLLLILSACSAPVTPPDNPSDGTQTCESICSECGKCTDASCTACAEKCEGHEPEAHTCTSVCEKCSKCTNTACSDEACTEKCAGHPEPILKTEAELKADGWTGEWENNTMFSNEKEGIYNYCPSIMETEDGMRHIYYCTNKDSYQIYDHIGYRRALKASDTGKWYYSPESLVIAPKGYTSVWTVEDYKNGNFVWDSLHYCDPSVIKGEFAYNGHTYKYLMALLVCANPYCYDNEIALAVADSPEGEWIVCDDSVNPVIKSGRKLADWGVGQADIISVDGKGKVLVTYTMANIGAVWQVYNMSDLNNIRQISMMKTPTKNGTVHRESGGTYTFYNAAYAFDNNTGTVYCIVEKQPHAVGDDPTYPAQVGTVQELFKFSLQDKDLAHIAKNCDLKAFEWQLVYTVDPALTGKPRNHNACIIRDEYGYVNGSSIELAVTINHAGNTGDNNTYLWDYKIARYEVK